MFEKDKIVFSAEQISDMLFLQQKEVYRRIKILKLKSVSFEISSKRKKYLYSFYQLELIKDFSLFDECKKDFITFGSKLNLVENIEDLD
jgi:hypothetical protein